MTHLKQLSTQPLTKVSGGAVIFLFIVALIGFADASYLTVEHFRNIIPPCTTSGCETVLTSHYSVILGIPDSLAGAVYYCIIMIGALIFLESKYLSNNTQPRQLKILKWTLFLTTIGLLVSLFLVYLQAFVIHSYCQYCLGSALTSTILFVTAMEILRKNELASATI